MSVLSDRDLRAALVSGEIAVEPFDDRDVQPASIDLHLDRTFRVFRNNRYGYIDPRAEQPELTDLEVVGEGERFMLHPGEFVLGQTLERISVGNALLGRLDGKSRPLPRNEDRPDLLPPHVKHRGSAIRKQGVAQSLSGTDGANRIRHSHRL